MNIDNPIKHPLQGSLNSNDNEKQNDFHVNVIKIN